MKINFQFFFNKKLGLILAPGKTLFYFYLISLVVAGARVITRRLPPAHGTYDVPYVHYRFGSCSQLGLLAVFWLHMAT